MQIRIFKGSISCWVKKMCGIVCNWHQSVCIPQCLVEGTVTGLQFNEVAWNDASLQDNITLPLGTMNINRNPNKALNW